MKISKIALSLSIVLAAPLMVNNVVANPTGAQVVNGQVSFSNPNANTLQINNSNGAIINWQNFSINNGETTHFQQSGANSSVLNNVVSGNVSNIFGSLTSNGQVFLINPNGIVFGQNSIVNTAGFIASTLNLSNQDYLEGKLNFNGVDAGDILNQGFITAGESGDIALIAPNITNEGVISVEQGDVILAAGESVTLASLDASAVGFEVQAAENTVTNLGEVTTDGGAVGMFAGTLTHDGVIEANALSLDENGNVVLVAKNNLTLSENSTTSANGNDGGRVVIQNETGTTWVSGNVEANGENGNGGVIDVLGQRVGLIDNAILSVDGKTGGGELHVGGNFQGNGPLQNAEAAFVGQSVSLNANAIETGDGGNVIVWSDGATRFHGSINATGGLLSGNGGFVETSGKQYLDVTGIQLDLLANHGSNGEWLLDPFDLTIGSGGDLFVSVGPNFESTNTGSNLNVDTLVTFLNAGTSVTINTGTIGGDLGDITVATPIAVTGGTPVSLTLDAENDIIVNFAIASSNAPLALTLNADSNYNAGADGLGAITINAAIITNGGAATFNAADGITFSEFGDVTTGLGAITLTTVTNDITLGSFSVDAADLTSTADINISAGGSFVMNNGGLASTIVSGNSNVSVVANDVSIAGTINTGTGNLLISSTPGIDMSLGAAGFGLSLDATEFALLSAGTFFLGQAGIGAVDILATLDSTAPLVIEGSNINFLHTISSGINASADVSLIAAGSINGNAAALLDIIANNIDLTAGFGIGDVDPLEIQFIITPGQLSFNNAANNVNIINTALSPTDIMRVTGDNSGLGGTVTIKNDLGITDVAGLGVTTSAGLLELTGLQINVNATLDNNNFSAPIAMKLLGDEIEINANIFSTSGGLLLSSLNVGGIINFDTTSNPTGDLDFAQAEIAFINAFSIDFGELANTSDMVFAAPMNFGATDVSFNAGADIQFAQGASTAITTTGIVKLDSAANIVGQPTAFVDIDAGQLEFLSSNGFGDTIGDAIEVNVGLLSGTNQAGSIYIDSAGLLNTGIINQNGTAPVWVEAAGDIVLATINASGGDVVLDTSQVTNGVGGAILDGAASPNIDGALLLQMISETGIGTLANPVEVANISGNIDADVASPGSIYIDNVGSLSGSLSLNNITTSAGEIFIRNLNSLQSTDINTLLSSDTDITIESNSIINVFNNVTSTGGDINLLVVGGAGGDDVFINSSVQASVGIITLNTVDGDVSFGASGSLISSSANLTATNGNIFFGAGGFINSPIINLFADLTIDDALSINAIGGGVTVNQLSATAGGNILLDGAANDTDQLLLVSTGGNITYNDVNDINLDGAYATLEGTGLGTINGNVALSSGGQIFDANATVENIAAFDAVVNAVNGIGDGDQIETRIGNSLSFNNTTEGTVHFLEQTANNIQFFGSNNSANSSTTDFTQLISQNGSITVPAGQTLSSLNTDIVLDSVAGSIFVGGNVSVANAGSEIRLLAPVLNVTGTGNVTAAGTVDLLAVLLQVDDLNITAGGVIDAGVGDLAIENLTDGNSISIGGVSGDLSLTALDIAALTGGRIGIGQNGGSGNDAGSVIIEGPVNLGTTDTRIASNGDITFNQGAADGITIAANLELDAFGSIVDNSTGSFDVSAFGLSLLADNGIGALNALDTQVQGIQIKNFLAGDIAIDNASANLSIAYLNQDAAAGNVTLTNSGNIDFIDNAVDIPGLTSANGSVILTSTTGSILDAGITNSHILGANDITLSSSTGIGTFATPLRIEDLGAGGLNASATGTGSIYIDHAIGTLISDFNLASLSAGSGEVILNNLNAAQDFRIVGPVSVNGANLSLLSPSSMFVDANITDAGAGTIDLQVTGAGGNLFVGAGTIQSNAGNISLTADTDITFNSTGNIDNSAGGLTSLFAGSGAVNGVIDTLTTAGIIGGGDLNASAIDGIALGGNNDVASLNLSNTNNNIVFNDINNILLGTVATSSLGSITLTSSGAIIDDNLGLNNLTAQTLTINAVNGIGSAADPIETSIDNFIQFTNSTANDVYIVNSVPNNILLNGSNSGGDIGITYEGNVLLQNMTAAGDITLMTNLGSIQDVNGAGVNNLNAANITLAAFGNIGDGDPVNNPAPIDTQLNAANGTINVSNTNAATGHIEILNTAVNTTDIVTWLATNAATNGEVYLLNPQGRSIVSGVTSNAGFIEIKATDLLVTGVVNNNDLAGITSVLLVTDELDISAGSLNANLGELLIETFTNGRAITLGATDASNTSLDLLQADVGAFTATTVSIGVLSTAPLFGSGDINVAGSLDFGAADVKLQTLGNINFNNATATGLSTTASMSLQTEQQITSDASTGVGLIASDLSILANTGVGSINPLRTQTSTLTIFNQQSGDVALSNTGALSLSDSANQGGALSIKTDGVLTLTPNAGLAGTTGAIASTELVLEGVGGLLVNGVASATTIRLLSENGIGINDTVTATGLLQIDSDTNGDAIGDLLIENISVGTLRVSAQNINLNAASVALLSSSGAVQLASNNALNLVAANDLSLSGGDVTDASAYISSRGPTNIDVGGNILLTGGTALNSSVAIYDESGDNANTMSLAAGGNVTLSAGSNDNSGALISGSDLNMTVAGDITLTGGIGNQSPAIIRGTSILTKITTDAALSLIDGSGTQSGSRIIANGGFGYLDLSFASCTGCAGRLIFQEAPIESPAIDEAAATTNTSPTGPVISSTDILKATLEAEIEEGNLTNEEAAAIMEQFLSEGDKSAQQNGEIVDEEKEGESTTDTEKPRVLVCR